MAKFYGVIGYGTTSEEAAGVWVDTIFEYPYYGDVIRNTRRLESGESLNENIVVNNQISIIADQYANEHFLAIKFVEWAGTLWTVSNVEVRRPRLLLTLGDVYNGPRATPET